MSLNIVNIYSSPVTARNWALPLRKTSLAAWIETQMTNQRQCNHGQWPETNVGQQIWTGSLSAPDVNSTDNNQP